MENKRKFKNNVFISSNRFNIDILCSRRVESAIYFSFYTICVFESKVVFPLVATKWQVNLRLVLKLGVRKI